MSIRKLPYWLDAISRETGITDPATLCAIEEAMRGEAFILGDLTLAKFRALARFWAKYLPELDRQTNGSTMRFAREQAARLGLA